MDVGQNPQLVRSGDPPSEAGSVGILRMATDAVEDVLLNTNIHDHLHQGHVRIGAHVRALPELDGRPSERDRESGRTGEVGSGLVPRDRRFRTTCFNGPATGIKQSGKTCISPTGIVAHLSPESGMGIEPTTFSKHSMVSSLIASVGWQP